MIKKIVKKLFEKRDDRELRLIREKIRNTFCKYKLNISDKDKMDGKVAVITGGSGALGSSIAFRLASEGATVIVCGRNKENLDSVVEQIKNNNGVADILELDVTNYDVIEKGFLNIEKKYGKIDILINAAGGSAREKHDYIINEDISTIDYVIDSNLKSTIYCSKVAARIMRKNNYGRIVNFGSVMGENGAVTYSDYASSKFGIVGFTKSFAMEVAKYNIMVNCVSPGITNQIIWDKPLPDFKTNKNYIGRTGKTDEVANAVEFFCREETSYIIGQNLIVDGGRSLGLKGE